MSDSADPEQCLQSLVCIRITWRAVKIQIIGPQSFSFSRFGQTCISNKFLGGIDAVGLGTVLRETLIYKVG